MRRRWISFGRVRGGFSSALSLSGIDSPIESSAFRRHGHRSRVSRRAGSADARSTTSSFVRSFRGQTVVAQHTCKPLVIRPPRKPGGDHELCVKQRPDAQRRWTSSPDVASSECRRWFVIFFGWMIPGNSIISSYDRIFFVARTTAPKNSK